MQELWKHQEEGIKRARDLPGYALFYEMGCGKTRTVIEIIRDKYNDAGKLLKTLVFTPPVVVENFKEEILKFSKIPGDKIYLLQGSATQRLKRFTESPEPRIFITNYEALMMDDLFQAFRNWQPDILICDESQRLKDGKAKRTKRMHTLANGGKDKMPIANRYLLSGSPVLNSPMDLFTQFLILDGGMTFGHNMFIFRAQYFYDKNAGMPARVHFPDWRLRPGALEEIGGKIAGSSMRVLKKDCLDLPPLIRQTIRVGMTPEQSKAYREMKQDFVTSVENARGDAEQAIATMALTKALRLMQISSGFVKTSLDNNVKLGKTPKQEALKELLQQLTPEHKVIVWSVWKENYEQIRSVCKDIGIEYVEVTGETAPHERFENVKKFNADPAIRVFSGHPGSGGVGVNLVVAPYCIFYSRTFSLEFSLQAEARNHRGGSEIHEKITRYDLVCADTIDELVQISLANKEEVSNKVLRSSLLLELKNQRI